MNKLKKLISKTAMAAAAITVLTATIATAGGTSASASSCPSDKNCCYYASGYIAASLVPPALCCADCTGTSANGGFKLIVIGGQRCYCRVFTWNPQYSAPPAACS